MKKLNQDGQKVQEDMGAVEKDLEDLKDEKTKLEGENTTLKKEDATLTAANASLKTDNTQLEEKIANGVAQIQFKCRKGQNQMAGSDIKYGVSMSSTTEKSELDCKKKSVENVQQGYFYGGYGTCRMVVNAKDVVDTENQGQWLVNNLKTCINGNNYSVDKLTSEWSSWSTQT